MARINKTKPISKVSINGSNWPIVQNSTEVFETQTVIPSDTDQLIVASAGKTLSGVTVQGDTDLVAENIKSGTEIFGVTGNYEGNTNYKNATVTASDILNSKTFVDTNGDLQTGTGIMEGLYIWKKCTPTNTSVSTVTTDYWITKSTSDANVYYADSYTFDATTGLYTLINPTKITLKSGSQSDYWNVGSGACTNYFIFGTPSGTTMGYNAGEISYVYGYTTGSEAGISGSQSNKAIYTTQTTYTLVDYVVSDNASAYPDDGEQNGYWFEKLTSSGISDEVLASLGCTKYEICSYTPSSKISGTVAISHSLGVIPKFALYYGDADYGSYVVHGARLLSSDGIGGSLYTAYQGASCSSYGSVTSCTTTTAYIYGSSYFQAGITYNIILLA